MNVIGGHLKRLELGLRWALLAACCAVFGGFLVVGWGLLSRYNTLRLKQEALIQQFNTTRGNVEELEGYIFALQNDPQFAEKVVRSRLNYCREKEIIVRIEETAQR